MRNIRFVSAPFPFLLFFYLTAGVASAETINCDGGGAAGSGAGRITTVPFTITAPGVYCVTQKITSNLASGAAITINANNVLLDLNDFAIGNIGAGTTTTAVGIFAQDRQNIHIRNGVLRGFWAGVALVNGTSVGLTSALSSGHTVESIITDTSYAIGITVEGPYVTVKSNKVMNTQGSNVVNPTFPNSQNFATGIGVGQGVGIHVVDNVIYNTDCINGCTASTATVLGMAIETTAYGAVIEGNTIINQAISAVPGSRGIFFGGHGGTAASFDSFVYSNNIVNYVQGIFFCSNTGFVCTGVMIGNLTTGVTTPYVNGSSPVPTLGTNF